MFQFSEVGLLEIFDVLQGQNETGCLFVEQTSFKKFQHPNLRSKKFNKDLQTK